MFSVAASFRMRLINPSASLGLSIVSRAGTITASGIDCRVRWLSAEKNRMASTVSPKKLDPQRVWVQGRKHIDDPTAYAEIPGFFCQRTARVAPGDQFGDQSIAVNFFSGQQQLGKCHQLVFGNKPLQDRIDGRHQQRRP